MKVDHVGSAKITLDDNSLFVNLGSSRPEPSDTFGDISLKLFGDLKQISSHCNGPFILKVRKKSN